MRRALFTIVPVVVAAFAYSCQGMAVGYQGPIPSVEARQSLRDLWGKTLPAGSVAFTDKELTLVAFLVGPFAPTVIVDEPGGHATPRDGRHWVPVLTDGDIDDLYGRATGRSAPGRGLEAGRDMAISEVYPRKMTGEE